ncbi:MAG: translation initiation factor IF-2 subunit alpha [Candidatus Micrarchaeota archaeon]|nr:translation initiation factor IF-2 subunit alpha [Candidatus Micrarchaeota archaeon]
MAYPESGEFVLATVKKIMPYGAFCSLDEYQGVEGFLHISEVSSGWIRNIREHVKEGQKMVLRVTNVLPEKKQIDLSLKRVSEAERKAKMEERQAEKRGQKLLERAASKIAKTGAAAMREAGEALEKDYGRLWDAFEAAAKGELKTKLSKQWLDVITEVAKQEIKPKRVEIRGLLKLQSFSGEGVGEVRAALSKVKAMGTKEVTVGVHYLGAPNYYVDIEAGDYKTAEKMLDSISKALEAMGKKDFEFSLEKKKE